MKGQISEARKMVLKGGEMGFGGGGGVKEELKEQVRGKVVLKTWKCEGTC